MRGWLSTRWRAGAGIPEMWLFNHAIALVAKEADSVDHQTHGFCS
jgi:hypothetical protein